MKMNMSSLEEQKVSLVEEKVFLVEEKTKLITYFKEAVLRMRPFILKMYNKMLEDDSTKEYKFKGQYKKIFDFLSNDEKVKETFGLPEDAKLTNIFKNLFPLTCQMMVAVADGVSFYFSFFIIYFL